MFVVAIPLAPAGFWAKDYYKGVPDSNLAFAGIFGQSQAIIVASLIAFFGWADFGRLCISPDQTRDRRITYMAPGYRFYPGVTIVDSFVVLFIAFYVAPRIAGNTQPWRLHR
jgi:hypothetical protein